MSKYNFKKGSTIELSIPEQYQLIIEGRDGRLAFIYNRASNGTYTINNWTISLIKATEDKALKCNFRKRLKPNEMDEIDISIFASDTGRDKSVYPKLLYLRSNGLFDEKETVTIHHESADIHVCSMGLMELNQGISPRPGTENPFLNRVNSDGLNLSHMTESQELQSFKTKQCELEDDIKNMNEEIESLKKEIEIREAEYRKLRNELDKKRDELKGSIDDLNMLQLDGELDLQKLNQEYQDRLAEIEDRFGDTKFALERILKYKKASSSMDIQFNRIENEIKELDDSLMSFVKEAEKESKDLAGAIFNNDGKWVR